MALEYPIVKTGPDSGTSGNLDATRNFPGVLRRGKDLDIVAAWSGNVAGTFALQVTYDGTNWDTVPGASAEFTANGNAQPAGSAGRAVWNFKGVPGVQWRLLWTRSSGSGALTYVYTMN